MLVYGGRSRRVSTATALEELEARLDRLASTDLLEGTRRLLIDAGALAQGLLDESFSARGCDDDGPLEQAVSSALIALAGLLRDSWHARLLDVAPPRRLLQALARHDLPLTHTRREAEGFAFYAVYPEMYLVAAERLRERVDDPFVVIGIRTIGTALGAMVAAALRAPLVTVRPVGDPSRRELRLGNSLARLASRAGPRTRFALVDEGPGLSGSSFGCLADHLESARIASSRIHFFPSHAGAPGPSASAGHRQRWTHANRHIASFEEVILPRLARALRPDAELRDLSGGRWRACRPGAESAPCWPQGERRKFLFLRAKSPRFARFAGLDASGETRLELARRLSAAGFAPPVHGLSHGFLTETWIDAPVPQRVEPQHLARYLRFRRDALPPVEPGASVVELATMIRRNLSLALGRDVVLDHAWDLDRIARNRSPIRIDGRLHRREWLACGSTLFKADAVDHHCGHDLIGGQDVAWDLAGAEIELGLLPAAADMLAAALDRKDPELRSFHRLAYLAFHLGTSTLAAASCSGIDARRNQDEVQRYLAAARAELDRGSQRRP
jgi:hypothetical protein